MVLLLWLRHLLVTLLAAIVFNAVEPVPPYLLLYRGVRQALQLHSLFLLQYIM